MDFRAWTVLFLFASLSTVCKAQGETEKLLAELISALADDLPEDFDYSEFHEQLTNYHQQPIDLNKTNGDDLRALLFLTPQQVDALLTYRAENGPFIDLLELQSIEGIDLPVIRKLLLFVKIKPKLIEIAPIHVLFKNAKGELLIRYGRVLQNQAGYEAEAGSGTEPAYKGSPAKILVRYRYTVGSKLGFTIVVQKDAGEAVGSTILHPKVDLPSLNLSYSGDGTVRKLVAGNYVLQFGQGLTMWSGLSLGKGGVIATIPRQGTGLKPATGSSSLMALRGGAATLQYGRISVTPFISFVKLDASLELNPVTGIEEVTAVDVSGLHRTRNELEKNDSFLNRFMERM